MKDKKRNKKQHTEKSNKHDINNYFEHGLNALKEIVRVDKKNKTQLYVLSGNYFKDTYTYRLKVNGWLELVYHAKWNKSVKQRQILYDFTHMWSLRMKTDEHWEEGKEKKERKTSYKWLLMIENK